MGYAVLHLDKASGNEAKMTAHIERTQVPKNADPERTHLNRNLIDYPDGVNDRTEAIQHRLDNAGLQRAIGKNQVRAIRIMLTGSNEEMKRIESEGKLNQWCDDNLDWLRKTYGTDNLVSAVLHLDEATPHIHATVVPIVTGERRKVKEKKKQDEPGKKKYRKKNPDIARLCADDVMTRIKLKEYQDSYAGAMNKYGLERGIAGSDARHITTQEFYRNAIAMQGNLQENIELLLQVEESKRQTIEDLIQKEQTALADYKEADTLKQQKVRELDKTQSELKEVKGRLKTEKFRSSAAEAGSALMDGISSALGTTKVKRQQQEIEKLKTENQNQQEKISALARNINRECEEKEKIRYELTAELDKIYEWLPDTKPLIRMGEYCKSIGFTDEMVKTLVSMQPVHFSGALYSKQHAQRFDTSHSEACLKRDTAYPDSFNLLIDKINIFQWFKQKYNEFLKRIGVKIPERKEHQGKGFKM
jgi:hypothetical protein